MKEFKIEKKVPIPEERAKYPFGKMVIGDSFFVSGTKSESARIAAHSYGTKTKTKFMCRKIDAGMRIWRIK